jgi:hypothetical protein
MKKLAGCAVLVSAALCGCNQAAQQQAAANAAAATQEYYRQYQAEAARCTAWLGDPRFNRIRARIADRDPTVEQLADTGKPSGAERGLVIQWATMLDGCGANGFGPPGGVTPEQRQLALASLAAGEISYGGYNRKIAETRAATMAKSEQALATAAATQAGMQAAIDQARAQAATDALVNSMSNTITNAIFAPRRR